MSMRIIYVRAQMLVREFSWTPGQNQPVSKTLLLPVRCRQADLSHCTCRCIQHYKNRL